MFAKYTRQMSNAPTTDNVRFVGESGRSAHGFENLQNAKTLPSSKVVCFEWHGRLAVVTGVGTGRKRIKRQEMARRQVEHV